MVYSDDNWSHNLGIDEEGPVDKQKDLWKGSSPYLKQFPSGETVLSYGNSSNFLVRLGDAKARNFYTPYMPFGRETKGCWGSLEPDGTHTMIGIFPKKTDAGNGICIGKMNLNHTLYAGNVTVTVDGNTTEWTNSTDALFVGSASQAQANVRMSYDDDNLYVLVERLDYDLTSQDTVNVYLASGTQGLSENSLGLTVGPNGLQQVTKYSNGRWCDVSAPRIHGEVFVRGTVDASADQDDGYMVEIVIPRTEFPVVDHVVRCAPVLFNMDKGTSLIQDGLECVNLKQPSTWFKVLRR